MDLIFILSAAAAGFLSGTFVAWRAFAMRLRWWQDCYRIASQERDAAHERLDAITPRRSAAGKFVKRG